jgi:hypothetical protein
MIFKRREELAAKMTLAEELQRRRELKTRKERLLLELQPFAQEKLLRHPLITTDFDPDHAAPVNDSYRDRKSKATEAFEKRNWSTYIFLHEKPHRLHALTHCIRFGLSGPDYWSCVGKVWVDSENIHQNLREWRSVWRSQKPGLEECINDDERAVLAGLPDFSTGVARYSVPKVHPRDIVDNY